MTSLHKDFKMEASDTSIPTDFAVALAAKQVDPSYGKNEFALLHQMRCCPSCSCSLDRVLTKKFEIIITEINDKHKKALNTMCETVTEKYKKIYIISFGRGCNRLGDILACPLDKAVREAQSYPLITAASGVAEANKTENEFALLHQVHRCPSCSGSLEAVTANFKASITAIKAEHRTELKAMCETVTKMYNEICIISFRRGCDRLEDILACPLDKAVREAQSYPLIAAANGSDKTEKEAKRPKNATKDTDKKEKE